MPSSPKYLLTYSTRLRVGSVNILHRKHNRFWIARHNIYNDVTVHTTTVNLLQHVTVQLYKRISRFPKSFKVISGKYNIQMYEEEELKIH